MTTAMSIVFGSVGVLSTTFGQTQHIIIFSFVGFLLIVAAIAGVLGNSMN